MKEEKRDTQDIEPATLAGEVIVGVQTPLGLGIGKLPGWWWQECMGETKRGRGRACGRWKSRVLWGQIRIETPLRYQLSKSVGAIYV